MQSDIKSLSYGTSRTVAANHITRAEGFGLSLTGRIKMFQSDDDGSGNRRVIINSEADKFALVKGFHARRCVTHVLQIKIMHPGLVQDYMRELGQTIFHVLYASAADDVERRWRARCAYRLARHLQRVDEIGGLVDAAEIADGATLVVALCADRVALDAALVERIAREDPADDLALIGYLNRRMQRSSMLLGPPDALLVKHVPIQPLTRLGSPRRS